ncbi:MAG: DUF4270 family protein [Bacteroidetes bacterium]|nr:DUF4270 family protein [Bacteroidota bacterium]
MKIFKKILFFGLTFLMLTQCKKDQSVLNTSVQPAGDLLNTDFNGSLPVYAHTVKYDSIAMADDRYKYLGSNHDPIFGRTDIGLYLNANMNLTFVNFGSNASYLSSEIILALSIDSTYIMGSLGASLNYSVFTLDSVLNPYRIYYSTKANLHNPTALVGSFTGSLTTLNGKGALRIPINDDYAKSIFNNPDNLVNNETFQKAYKGFYITAAGTSLNSGNEGVIFKCNLDDALSGFYLRYQKQDSTGVKTDTMRFTFTGVTASRFNNAKFDFNNGGNLNLIQQVINKDTSAGSQSLFLKGMGASKLKVYIPALTSYVDSAFTLAINRAEVEFKLDPTFENDIKTPTRRYIVPPRLLLLPMDSLGREIYAPDQSNSARYDGVYDSGNKRYVFNIARYAQQVIKGQRKNYGFYLVVANTDLLYSPVYDGNAKELLTVRRDNFIERVVLSGNNGTKKPVLNLSCIKLKKN